MESLESNVGNSGDERRLYLADRIIRRYGQSPGVISRFDRVAAGPRAAKFAVGRVPVFRDFLQRWGPAYLGCERSWPSLAYFLPEMGSGAAPAEGSPLGIWGRPANIAAAFLTREPSPQARVLHPTAVESSVGTAQFTRPDSGRPPLASLGESNTSWQESGRPLKTTDSRPIVQRTLESMARQGEVSRTNDRATGVGLPNLAGPPKHASVEAPLLMKTDALCDDGCSDDKVQYGRPIRSRQHSSYGGTFSVKATVPDRKATSTRSALLPRNTESSSGTTRADNIWGAASAALLTAIAIPSVEGTLFRTRSHSVNGSLPVEASFSGSHAHFSDAHPWNEIGSTMRPVSASGSSIEDHQSELRRSASADKPRQQFPVERKLASSRDALVELAPGVGIPISKLEGDTSELGVPIAGAPLLERAIATRIAQRRSPSFDSVPVERAVLESRELSWAPASTMAVASSSYAFHASDASAISRTPKPLSVRGRALPPLFTPSVPRIAPRSAGIQPDQMPLARSFGGIEQALVQTNANARMSNTDSASTLEVATPQAPAATRVATEVKVDLLVDKALRKFMRQLAVESERRGWTRWV